MSQEPRETDWVWGISRHVSADELESILSSCYAQVLSDEPKLKQFIVYPFAETIIQYSRDKDPRYRRASLLLAIFFCISTSPSLANNVRRNYYPEIGTRWKFDLFLDLVSREILSVITPGKSTRVDIIDRLVNLLALYKSHWEPQPLRLPTAALQKLAARSNNNSSAMPARPLPNRVIALTPEEE